jgi:hypothetical protein
MNESRITDVIFTKKLYRRIELAVFSALRARNVQTAFVWLIGFCLLVVALSAGNVCIASQSQNVGGTSVREPEAPLQTPPGAKAIPTSGQPEKEATAGDAYARRGTDGLKWTIGTKSIRMTFDGSEGGFRLVSFSNKRFDPPLEYVDPKSASAPFLLDSEADGKWILKSGVARQVASGGRPVVQLDLVLTRKDVAARYHVMALPGTPILRQWVEIENTGSQPVVLKSPAAAYLRMQGKDAASYVNYWMTGGRNVPTQGKLEQSPITAPYSRKLETEGTADFVPWMALHRSNGPRDGLFLAVECLGKWSLAVNHTAGGSLTATAGIPNLNGRTLKPGERLELPPVTLGVFRDDLEDMAVSLYDWQYEYLWDYTNGDYYARPKTPTPWFYCSRNLQEQFTARLANLDMIADMLRALGIEMLWDDAGWSSYPGGLPPDEYGSVCGITCEGPDFAQTQRYLQKMDMKWLLWFQGRQSNGLLDTKVGAWGDFEWRTDGISCPDLAADRGFRGEIKNFLDAHPNSSFHTCSGGSTYAHTFEIGGRYANVNMLSDLGRGPYLNYYFSFLETPDKWCDIAIAADSIYGKKDGSTYSSGEILAARQGHPWLHADQKVRYVPQSARSMLTSVPVPCWGGLQEEDYEPVRKLVEIYRFLRSEGLVGQWSYVFHPNIQGDQPYYYFQRTNRDRRKACIILCHQAENPVVIYPKGLLPDCKYVVGFDSTQDTVERTGADLTANGIKIERQQPGELVYLNLPHRPGGGRDKTPPQPPGRVLARQEVNIGHGGVGIYWSPGLDNNWISYYEVRRDGKVVDKVSVGNYDFDHAPGWDGRHEYAVRTVDGDGNVSAWTAAEPIAGEPLTFAALGGHFSRPNRDGWTAESAADGRNFTPMSWIPPARNPSADFGGTPNQRGGVEGYWESAGAARVGRGWQQASPTEAGCRTWTASRPGTVRVVGRAMREYYHRNQGDKLKVKILLGQKQIWPDKDWAIIPKGDLTGIAHDIKVNVAQDDALRFVLDKGSSPENDLLAWMPRIVYEEADAAPSPQQSAVRILCGSKSPYTDSTGNAWSEDKFFSGGSPMNTTAKIEAAQPMEKDQALYQHGREGKDFTYSIPVKPGLYALRLKFAEPKYPWCFQRPIDLDINGRRVMHNADITQMARGAFKAYEKAFRYLVPNGEGNLTLHFTSGFSPLKESDRAMVQAIELLPEIKPAVRIDCGSEREFIDWDGVIWNADTGFEGGQVLRSDAAVSQASPTLYDQELYRTARTGRKLMYRIGAPPGLYTVHLKFAELWLKKPGQRPMNVEINGRTVRQDWDPAAAAGQVNMAADIREENVAPDRNGDIRIAVEAAGTNDAVVQGIEVE